jgi:hypothetical protein
VGDEWIAVLMPCMSVSEVFDVSEVLSTSCWQEELNNVVMLSCCCPPFYHFNSNIRVPAVFGMYHISRETIQ